MFQVAGSDHPALFTSTIFTEPIHWVHRPPSQIFSEGHLDCMFRFQNTAPLMQCVLTTHDINPWHRSPTQNNMVVSLAKPLRAITPGQVRNINLHEYICIFTKMHRLTYMHGYTSTFTYTYIHSNGYIYTQTHNYPPAQISSNRLTHATKHTWTNKHMDIHEYMHTFTHSFTNGHNIQRHTKTANTCRENTHTTLTPPHTDNTHTYKLHPHKQHTHTYTYPST